MLPPTPSSQSDECTALAFLAQTIHAPANFSRSMTLAVAFPYISPRLLDSLSRVSRRQAMITRACIRHHKPILIEVRLRDTRDLNIPTTIECELFHVTTEKSTRVVELE